jgi:hypothetical protein
MKELRPAIADQARASARFLRSASDIIEWVSSVRYNVPIPVS